MSEEELSLYEIADESALELLPNFFEDLVAIYNKHGLYLSGCGCCGSPYVGRVAEGAVVTQVGSASGSGFLNGVPQLEWKRSLSQREKKDG